MSGLAPGRQNR